jgi:predicted nucleic acid-binding protein
MTYLVDANVLSEPTKPTPHPKAIAWLSAHEGDFVVDAVVLGEIYVGILVLSRGRKRLQPERWFETVINTIECVPWDSRVSRRWAQLIVDLKKKGHNLPVLDSMIAATALAHDLTVATRNVRHFQKAGVSVFDPFGG